MKARVIYAITVGNEYGEIAARRFARNKRTAKRIATKYKAYGEEFIAIVKLDKHDMQFVNPSDIEG